MIERFYSQRRSAQRLRLGPLEPHLDDYAQLLAEQGYSRQAGRQKPRLAADLSRWLERKRLPVEQLNEQRAREFILRDLAGYSPKRTQLATSALRSFLGHLYQAGQLATNLAGAVPTVSGHPLSGLPRFLEPEQVERLVNHCDRSRPAGQRDYAHGGRHRTMTLTLGEFLRRFALHLLPERFTKIRHYGLLANRGRQERLARVQALLAPAPATTVTTPTQLPTRPTPSTGLGDPDSGLRCPYCGASALVLLALVPRPGRRHPPFDDTS